VTDQSAEEVGEDGRAAGQTCAVLLARAGGRASDARAVRGDVATHREIAASGELTTCGKGRKSNRWAGRMMEKCRRNCRQTISMDGNSQNGTPSVSFFVRKRNLVLGTSVTRITVGRTRDSRRRFPLNERSQFNAGKKAAGPGVVRVCGS